MAGTPDIELLIGALGKGSPKGESANLIRGQLQNAINKSNPAYIRVALSNSGAKELKRQIQQIISDVKLKPSASDTTHGKNTLSDQTVVSKMQAGLERTIVNRRKAERTEIEAQSRAINKALEEEYKLRLKNEELARRTREASSIFTSNARLSLNSAKEKYSSIASSKNSEGASLQQQLNDQETKTLQLIREVEQGTVKLTATRRNEIQNALSGYSQIGQKLKESSAEYTKNEKNIQRCIPLQAQFNAYLRTVNPKGLHESSTEIAAINKLLKDGDINAAQQSITNLKAHFKDMGYEGGNAFSYLHAKIKSFSTYLASSAFTMLFVTSFRNALTAVKDIDAALTQLQIVTGASDLQMTKFLKNATSLAKDLGQSISDVLGSIETFSRLGYDLGDSTKLAQYAGILSNVANVETEEATTGLTSIIKGYNMDVANAEHVADVLIQVGQKYAVSASELMEAFERSGAALNATNTSFEKSAGLIAAANSSVQNASTVGTAIRTVSARIRGAKSDLSELGEETEDLADGFSKYAAELKALTGFDIMVEGSSDTYKDIYDIFAGISQAWGDLSDTQQARVAEILGGTRQLQTISSILGNWTDAVGAYTDAMESAGVATSANAEYMDSIGAKANRASASFAKMANDIIPEWLVSIFYDVGNGLFQFLGALDGLPARIVVVTAAILSLGTAFNTLKVSTIGMGFTNTIKSLKDLWAAITLLPSAFAAAKSGSMGLGAALKVLNFDPVSIGISAACIAIVGAVALFNKLHKSTEELVKSSNELKNSFNDFESQTRNNIETLRSLSTEFKRLAKGVDRYGNNVSLSADQYERYKEIVEDIVGMSPSLIEGYDKENGYLVDKNGLLERAIELQEKEYKQELRRMTTTSKLSDAMAGSVATYGDLRLGDALTTETSFKNSIYQLFRINDRDDIAKGTQANEAPYLARQILEALHVEDVEAELQKFFNEHGYWQSSWFWDEYVDRIATDINSGHSVIAAAINYDEAGFESRSAFEAAVSDAENAAQSYIDVQGELAQANKDVSDQLMLVAESNDKYAELSAGARQIVSDFVNTFGVEQVSRDGFFGGKVIDNNAVTAAKVDINNFVEKLTPEIQNAIDDLYSQDFSAMTGEQIADALPKAEELVQKIADVLELTDEQVNKIRIKLGLTFNLTADDGTVINDREDMVDYLSSKIQPIIGKSMDREFEVGNVDLTLRPKVSGQAMIDAGWDEDPDSYGTVLTSAFDIKDANGNTVIVHATPILPDGTVLSPDELANYIEGELAGATDILNTDKEKRGIVLAVDTNVELNSDGSVSDAAWEKADQWDVRLHEVQDQYYDTARLLDSLNGEQLNKLFSIPPEELAKYNSWDEILQSITASESPDTVSSLKEALAGLSDETTVLRDAMAKLGEGSSVFDQWIRNSENLKALLDKFPDLRDELEACADAVAAGAAPQEAFATLQQAMNAAIADFNTDQIYEGVNDVVSSYEDYGAGSNQVLQAVQNLAAHVPGLVDSLYDEDGALTATGLSAVASANALYDAAIATLEMQKKADNADLGKLIGQFDAATEAAIATKIAMANSFGDYGDDAIEWAKGTIISAIDASIAEFRSAKAKYGRAGAGSGKTKSTQEVYVPDVDPLYGYLQTVEDINDELDGLDIDEKLLDEDDFKGKNNLIEKRIDALKRLQTALHDLNNARDVELNTAVEKLNSYGNFNAIYDAESGQAVINNMDALKGLTGETAKAAEALISTIESGSKAAISTSLEYMNTQAEINNLLKEGTENSQKLYESPAGDELDRIKNRITRLQNRQDVFGTNLDHQSVMQDLGEEKQAYQEMIDLAVRMGQELEAQGVKHDDPRRAKWSQVYFDGINGVRDANRKMVDKILKPYDEFISNADTYFWWDNIDDTKADVLSEKLARIHEMYKTGLIPDAEMYKELVDETAEALYKEQLDAIDQTIEYTKKLIEEEVRLRKEELEEQVDDYKKIVDLKKESLRASKDEADYQKSVAEKTKAIAKLQQQINTLALSDDRRDIAERKKLEEELAGLQGELADTQADHTLEAQEQALDDSYDAFEKEKNDEVKKLEATIDTEGKLYAAAIKRIDEDWDDLYSDLMNMNSLYWDGIAGEAGITGAWKTAKSAASEYFDVLDARQGLEKKYVSASGGNIAVGDTEVYKDKYGLDWDTHVTVQDKANQMRSNSNAWHAANSAGNTYLADTYVSKNEDLVKDIEKLIGKKLYRDHDGVWHIDDGQGTQLYKVYHKGGIVGANEEFAKIEKGELIVPKEHVKPTMKMLEWGNSLASKMKGLLTGGNFVSAAMSNTIKGAPLSPAAGAIVNNNAPSFAPNIQVEVKYDSSASPADAKRFGENITAGITEAFRRKGIGTGTSPLGVTI